MKKIDILTHMRYTCIKYKYVRRSIITEPTQSKQTGQGSLLESGVFAMIGTNANSFQVNTNAAQSATQTAVKTENRAAVETKVESRVESDVKREEAGKDAAEQMRKENTAITEKPAEGIQLEISKKGLEKEKQAQTTQEKAQLAAKDDEKAADKKVDEKSATEQRVEEQQKVKARIKEQVDKELEDQKQENKQVERREEDKKDQAVAREKATEGEETRKEKISNFAGYTNAQLQQMAQKGEISRNDYNTEIEKREEKLAETQSQMETTDRDMANNISRMDKVDRQMGAVETAFDEDSNQNNINAETRAEIVQNLENPQQNTAVQQDNQREQQSRAFAQWQNDFGFLIR